ncbi:cellulose biosynthesis protein BcsE [Rahnella victoriana]|jgi:cellulose biosynthesis protein BcsE|uniref:Cellulose biosynthesis protein BcsE n=1 Tax=Rahnella victoriana TaxID=1510570 RepID=A0ABS0DPM8_9GAMM|nr:cellulose biosynthesis protein BcsE [Rahnella victoriana]MBF7955780.1 cellulose biosynthesis protein BcsE [Rahnella victoriana]UHM90185.1 cellulose biosynthesis protein BcsE [Rahnella victoriana]
MAHSFSLGRKQFWNGLALMQAQGLYWVNTDSQDAAYRLCGQAVDAQQGESPVSVFFPQHNLLCTSEENRLSDEDILLSHLHHYPKKTSYYQLAKGKKAFLALSADINRLPAQPSPFMILLLPASAWQDLNDKQFARWMSEMQASANNKGATLLIICYGMGINAVKTQLHLYHRNIYGLADLKTDVEPNQWGISWWHDPLGVEANTLYPLTPRQTGWEIHKTAATSVSDQTGDDQWMLLAERSVLEGAPALSERWFLFDDNDALTERASHARSATVIFALQGNDEVEVLARQVHRLRIQRGNGLKIVVREMNSSLRYVDQRLLQACGANLVVPHAARLSNFLTLLDDLQNLSFTRHVAEDIELLLDSRLPTHHKGYLPLPVFCEVMRDIWNHATLATESRGILISLRPAAGISPQQAMSLCSLRRDGDILTVTERHLYLFLSNCQVSDVENVLAFLFTLPVKEVFTSQTFWSQELDIQTEIRRLAAKPPMEKPVVAAEAFTPQKTGPLRRAQVHQPVPITLAVSDSPATRAPE